MDKEAESKAPVVTHRHYPLLPGTPEYEEAVAIREQVKAGTIKTTKVEWPESELSE